AADRVVALNPGSVITIPETANKFASKGNHLTLVKGNQFDGRTKTDPHKHIYKFFRIYDMFKYRDTKNEAVRLMMFPLSLSGEAKTWLDELNKGTIKTWDELQTAFISRFFPPVLFDRLLREIRALSQHENESLTDAWLRMKEMLIKLPWSQYVQRKHYQNLLSWSKRDNLKSSECRSWCAQYKELQIHAKKTKPYLNEDDIPMSREEEELISNKHKTEQISAAFLSDESSTMIQNKVPPKHGDPGSFLIPCNFNKTFSCNALADLGASINLMPYSLYAKLSLKTLKPTKMSMRLADRSFQYPVGIAENMLVEVGKFTFPVNFVILEMQVDRKVPLILGRSFLHTTDAVIQFSIDVIDEILEEDFDTLLDEGSKILYSIKRTLLEEEIFAEFNEFMAMTTDKNFDSKSDTEEPPFEKITINIDYQIKPSLEEPPTNLELKSLPDNLEYVFLEEPYFLPVIISSQLSKEKKDKLVSVLKNHKQAFAWKTTDIPGICPSFYKHKIQLLDDKKPVVQKQRRLNPNMQEVVKKKS
nr:reverse transcriptase domain-containing protein [Tanacetum cinerariifolium]